jgi:hypothetical protein
MGSILARLGWLFSVAASAKELGTRATTGTDEGIPQDGSPDEQIEGLVEGRSPGSFSGSSF